MPVVDAPTNGNSKFLRDRDNVALVEPGDTNGYAGALDAYARDPALRARHGEAGLAFAKTMDWDAINGAVMKVYQRVIERRARR
jgi:glycosyltransferase involved in cell wall biosynthesis